MLLFAQEPVDLPDSAREILYSQSDLLHSIDLAWSLPFPPSPANSNPSDPPSRTSLSLAIPKDAPPNGSSTGDARIIPQDNKAHAPSDSAFVSPTLQVITEVSGCLIMNMHQSNISADSLFYGGGFRWTPLAAHRFPPFGQFMFGGRKVTMEVDDLALRKVLMQEWNDGSGTLPHYPMRNAWSIETAQNGPSIAVGGGFDVVVTRPFAWRVLNLEYTHSWMNDAAQIHPQEGLKISTQAVVRIGTW